MRLIDADAFLDDAMERYCKDCDRRKGIKNGKCRIIYEIGEAPCRACSVDDMKCEIEDVPTVDAIPVEWIQNILTAMGDDSPYRPAIKWLLLTYNMEREE